MEPQALRGLHVFVAMPFGVKEGIDFNKVYHDYIKPALEAEGFEVFRADEEMQAGNIRTDMFQELLLADLVVADLSLDNPNVWYELGVRHALRARGIIQIACQRDYMPFDVYTDRKLKYRVKDGAPDPTTLEEDKAALARMAKDTVLSWHGRRISPVYHLLRSLQEPEWKKLKLEEAREFWEKQEEWEYRIEVARNRQRPGDILVLADEAPTRALILEAHLTAAKALRALGQFAYALEQTEKALAIDPKDQKGRREKGLLLGRLKKPHAAKEWLKDLVRDRDHPEDAENWALLGRIEKDDWIDCWRQQGKSPEEMRRDAGSEHCLLCEAVEPYKKGFLLDPNHYYSGINALTLLHVHLFLTGEDPQADMRVALEGGVRWAATSALSRETAYKKDFWARVTLADLEVLLSDTPVVERAYEYALAAAERDRFALESSRRQLKILQDLGFRPHQVGTALAIFDRALARLQEPERRWEARQVFLFSGHMIDAQDRPEPRFPAAKEQIALEAIAAKLKELQAGPEDLALCGGACGGDLLFAEVCLARGAQLEVRIPFKEPTFMTKSVSFAGEDWTRWFYEVKNHPNTTLLVMPVELGPTPPKVDPYERNNLWQLYTALGRGPEKVRFVCLWNRRGGDGPGGTKHMHDAVHERSGQVYVLDTNELFKGEDGP